jgi:hypothetical protein
MMKDGRLEQLEALASHDGTRDGGDVQDDRNALLNKIKADALDDAWLSRKITSEHYARENELLDRNEELSNRIADGDHDGVAAEYFASRHDGSAQESQLLGYLKDKYGDSPSVSRPPGEVVREQVVDMPTSSKRSAVDDMGIIDLDALEQDEG